MTYTFTVPKVVHHVNLTYTGSVLELVITDTASLWFELEPGDRRVAPIPPPRFVPIKTAAARHKIELFGLKPKTVQSLGVGD